MAEKRWLWEKFEDGFRRVELHATDALHALRADPERWSEEKPDEPQPEPPVQGFAAVEQAARPARSPKAKDDQ